MLAIQHIESDLQIVKPLLKDLLRAQTSGRGADDGGGAGLAGCRRSRITTPNVAPILDAWKQKLASEAQTSNSRDTFRLGAISNQMWVALRSFHSLQRIRLPQPSKQA